MQFFLNEKHFQNSNLYNLQFLPIFIFKYLYTIKNI